MPSFLAAVGTAMLTQYTIPLILFFPALILGGSGLWMIWYYVIGITVIALPLIVCIGFPAYLALRAAGQPRREQIQGVGMLIAVVAGLAVLGPFVNLWLLFLLAIHGAAGAAGFHDGWERFANSDVE